MWAAARRQGGFSFLVLLLVMALMGAVLAASAQVWLTLSTRDKETELLFAGLQFRTAIQQYYDRSPGGAKQFPAKLEDLLTDPRFPTVVRHLRKIYVDPLTGKQEWGLLRSGDRIIGVYSLALGTPIKQADLPKGVLSIASGAKSYQDWNFVAGATRAAAAGTGANSPPNVTRGTAVLSTSETPLPPSAPPTDNCDIALRQQVEQCRANAKGPALLSCMQEASAQRAACQGR